MHKLYELKQTICEELERQAEKGLTRESLDTIDKLAHAGKNVGKLIKMCEENEGGMSRAEGSYGSYRGSYTGSYDGPWSGGANGREGSMSMRGGSYRRDAMGRYSREAGYSRNADFAEELRKMGANLPENFRGEILRMADKMEHMEG